VALRPFPGESFEQTHDVGVAGHAAGDDPDVTGDAGLIIEAIPERPPCNP
jgi:hypothetical protein